MDWWPGGGGQAIYEWSTESDGMGGFRRRWKTMFLTRFVQMPSR